ncbi:MAG: DUF2924 domain-containing protein [Planctomycetes bacterium]|nr:DUF2924 domain-containing protein [Planctomycetota bacterium]
MAVRSGQLVCQHLERISGDVLELFPRIVREYARRRSGVYALYRREHLYYVGLAKDLRGRLRHHLRDRHHGRWDTFSMYLTLRNEHLKELESLILRISRPKGNRQAGKFVRSQNLNRELKRLMRQEQTEVMRRLLGLGLRNTETHTESDSKAVLAPFVRKGFQIRWRYKGVTYKARVRRDGVIRFRGRKYNSPSTAASAITRRGMNGWSCWRYERAPGDWVPLDNLRRR